METFDYYRGRVALYAILRGLGAVPGDEIIVPGYTCAAVVEPLIRLGLVPVFVDIDPFTYGPDPGRVADAVTSRTRAIIVQHTFGSISPDLSAFIGMGLPVIEDCAHVTGPHEVRGVAAFFSYEWGKPIVAGVGGTAVVRDPALASIMRRQYATFRTPPVSREAMMSAQYAAFSLVDRTGMVWRLRSLYRRLAGLGLVVGSYSVDPSASPEYAWRMTRSVRRRLPSRTRTAALLVPRRDAVAERYRAGLERLSLLTPPAGTGPLLRMPVPVADKAALVRIAAQQRLEVGEWFATPVHPLSGEALRAAGYTPGSCPNGEWAADHLITFPVRGNVRDADVDRGLRLVGDALGRPSGLPRIRVLGGPFTEFTDEQIRAVAEMHATEVSQGFLSSLGVPALEMLYRHVAASRHAALYIAQRGNEPVGYICGARDMSALLREFVLRKWWVAGPALVPKLLTRQRLRRLAETLRYASHAGSALPDAEIMNFVVQPDCRGHGIAQALFTELTGWFAAHGETAIKIVTGEEQRRAQGFYEKMGATFEGRTSIHHGATSRVYRYSLSSPHPSSTPPPALPSSPHPSSTPPPALPSSPHPSSTRPSGLPSSPRLLPSLSPSSRPSPSSRETDKSS
ncbi:GNAT family N-acetyltransferase [Actinoplanes sp. CA-030573]|uniref:GNAT family N-acetyltransferase n=1 Tax=Actinoplanes sp. CA-030573 TaxID=3239898 RepID=UPI003D9351FE